MNPSSAAGAGRQAALLAKKQLKGIASATARRRIARVDAIAQAIWKRWKIGIYRWQLKHVRWYLTQHTKDWSANNRYQFWLCLRSMLEILGRDRWLKSLRGDWLRPVSD